MKISGSGQEWIVDAFGCHVSTLTDQKTLQSLFDLIVREVGLHPIGKAQWHRFPVTHGYTGFWMLSESHLALHTFPEYESICLNLFCCKPREEWDWESAIRSILKCDKVRIRKVDREYGPPSLKERAC